MSGGERFRSIQTAYYRGMVAILVGYDCTNANSFNNCDEWIQQAERFVVEDASIVLVAMKNELPNKVISTEQGQLLAERYHLPFFETSSKDSVNVTEVFTYIVQERVRRCRQRAESLAALFATK